MRWDSPQARHLKHRTHHVNTHHTKVNYDPVTAPGTHRRRHSPSRTPRMQENLEGIAHDLTTIYRTIDIAEER